MADETIAYIEAHFARSCETLNRAAGDASVRSAIGEISDAIVHCFRAGGKLLLTGGISTVEGSGGGGLASWALIAGNETVDGIGGTVHATYVPLADYSLTSEGVAIGIRDRLELSYAHQRFDTQKVGAALGLGRGFSFQQDIIGAKLPSATD